jgi:hypothetical protein
LVAEGDIKAVTYYQNHKRAEPPVLAVLVSKKLRIDTS